MEALPQFIVAVLVLLIIPGPDMAYCIASGISHGARGAAAAAVGVGAGGLVLTAFTALIVFLAGSYDPKFFHILQVLGSLYLLYLGVSILAAKADSSEGAGKAKIVSQQRIFLRGVITNIANPKALVFFISFIPQFIPPQAQSPHWSALFLGVVLCAIGTSVNCLFGLAGVGLHGVSAKKIHGRAISDYITALLFISIAVFFLANYWQNR